MKRSPLTADKIAILKREYPDCINPKALAKKLGISMGSIYTVARRYGARRRCKFAHATSLHAAIETYAGDRVQEKYVTMLTDVTKYTMKDFESDLTLMRAEGFLSSIEYARYTARI